MGIYEGGRYIEVHPTFLYESLVTFAIFIILILMLNKRKFTGQLTLTYLIIYSFARMIIEGIRTDSLMIGEFRVSQVLSLIIFIVSSVIYVNIKRKEKL